MAGRYNKRSHDIIWSTLRRVCNRSTFIARLIAISGDVASFTMWQRAKGFDGGMRCRTRESLWRTASSSLRSGKVTVLEFGVAAGDATRVWLAMLDNPELRWHGFDTFTGLPDPWIRGGVHVAEPGTFDAGGVPAQVNDPRVTWHCGLVEETLPRADVDFAPRLCVLFDLDLYEPSAFALNWLAGRLKKGDLLYFDEAYDPWHERRLIDEFLDQGHRLRIVGSTGLAIMFEYQGGPTA